MDVDIEGAEWATGARAGSRGFRRVWAGHRSWGCRVCEPSSIRSDDIPRQILDEILLRTTVRLAIALSADEGRFRSTIRRADTLAC